jgi:autotransporter passenger strand-loop-strand repeat protein
VPLAETTPLVYGTVTSAVVSGGTQLVNNGGIACDTVLLNRANQLVLGTTSKTAISSGGFEMVVGGAIARDTVVSSGGELPVAGGTIMGTTTVAAGAFST